MDISNKRMNASEVNSFAYNTMKDRLPNIIVKGLDYFCRTWRVYLAKKFPNLDEKEKNLADVQAKQVLQSLSKLRYELTTNKSLIKLTDDYLDVDIWNEKLDKFIQENNCKPTYFDSPILYTECYVYRSMFSFFYKSIFFKQFDIFYEIKKEGLVSSLSASLLIVDYASNIKKRIEKAESTEEKEFIDYIEFDLWGNKCDLSLSIGKIAVENFNLLNDLHKQKDKILKNSTKDLYVYLNNLKKSNTPIRIDLVLDNCGLELILDFCFIEMLYQIKLLDEQKCKIYFHPKNFAWFVSDVLEKDIEFTLDYLIENLKSVSSKNLVIKWKNFFQKKNWQIQNHIFWTTSYEFCEMKNITPDLYENLSKSNLIIIKGDLNYRKLISDVCWEYSTPLKTALRGFLPASLVALRTIKFRPLCDIDKTEILPTLSKILDENGNFGVISFQIKN